MNRQSFYKCMQLVSNSPDFQVLSGGEVPSNLHEEYQRIALLEDLAEELPNILVESVLARLATSSNESDHLRLRCVELLISCQSRICESTLLALILDSDPEMRLMGLEGLVVTKSKELTNALPHLRSDSSPAISAAIKQFDAGKPIDLTYVDPV